MKRLSYLIYRLTFGVVLALLLAACSSDSEVTTDHRQPLPEGMGRIRITICTPEDNPDLTRAVNATPWEAPDHEWERLQTFRILICNTSNKVVQIISGTKEQMTPVTGTSYPYKQSATLTSEPLTAGDYNIYATANYTDGYAVGSTVNPDATASFYNGYSTTGTTMFGDVNPIPMTGKLNSAVTVSAGTETDAGTITVWRVMAKMQFYFTNEASEQIQIMGVEVDPINTNSDNQGLVYLFSKDDLTSTANLPASGTGTVTLPASGVTTGPVSHETSTETPLLTLAAKNDGNTDEGTLFFYVNETNATFTTTLNQYSLRFKIKRGGTISELRYGVTAHYGNGETGQDGFNVIRRNDWIHIPIILTDWHYRIEPLPFVPIGGYPAATVSSDGLTATFSTGGMIALQPFIKKKGDETWRDFGNTDISYGDDSWEASIHWKNINGTDVSGDDYIVKTAFAYDPDSKCIIGELNNKASILGNNYMTTFTVHLKLKGPKVSEDPETYVWYDYTFTFNIVLQ